jgi:aminoglycoside phosphotransferase (APT) family kinase protein
MASDDPRRSVRAALCRGMVEVIRDRIAPALSDAAARDALESIGRLLTIQIVADEQGEALWREFGPPLSRLARRRFREGGGQGALDALRRELAERTRSDAEGSQELMELEWRLQRALAAHRNRLSASEGSAQPPAAATSREAVQAYLRRRLARSPRVRVVGLDELPGGRVKASYRLSLEGTDELPPVTLLRLDKAKSLLATRTADEWPLLQALQQHGGVASPEPYLLETDPRPLGGTFIVMQWADGEKAGEIFPEVAAPRTHRREIVLHLARILARLHTMPMEQAGFPATTPEAILEAARARVQETYDRLLGEPVAEFEFGYRWILQHLADGLGPICVVHGDVGLHNLLVDGGRVTALVDWELAHLGSPAEDLARMRPLVEFMTPGGWDDFIAEYRGAGGPDAACERRRLEFYGVVSGWSAVSASLMCRQLYFSGALNDFVYATAGVDFVLRTRLMLMEALHQALNDR